VMKLTDDATNSGVLSSTSNHTITCAKETPNANSGSLTFSWTVTQDNVVLKNDGS
jgi:hypothetical protein